MKAFGRLYLLFHRCHLDPYAPTVSDFFIVIVTDFFKCNWAWLLQRSLGNISMHSRHSYGLVIIISRSEITEVEEELQVPLEIFVQEPIKDRVDTGGDHGSQVAEQE